jgi:amino acid permease
MSLRFRRYLQFGAASLLAYVVTKFGSHLLARMRYRDEDFAQTLSEVFGYLEPHWQAIEVAPFLLLGAVSASLAYSSFTRALGLFVVGLLAFATMYYFGYMDTEAYMIRRSWTAASIAAGLIPFKNLGVLVIILIARIFLGRPNAPAKV